jgi:hypothetical protein
MSAARYICPGTAKTQLLPRSSGLDYEGRSVRGLVKCVVISGRVTWVPLGTEPSQLLAVRRGDLALPERSYGDPLSGRAWYLVAQPRRLCFLWWWTASRPGWPRSADVGVGYDVAVAAPVMAQASVPRTCWSRGPPMLKTWPPSWVRGRPGLVVDPLVVAAVCTSVATGAIQLRRLALDVAPGWAVPQSVDFSPERVCLCCAAAIFSRLRVAVLVRVPRVVQLALRRIVAFGKIVQLGR